MAVRAEVVPARDGSVLGFFLIFVDLTDSQRVAEARRHLEQSLTQARRSDGAARDARAAGLGERDDLIGAILANASLAAMDIADGSTRAVGRPAARGARGLDAARDRALRAHPQPGRLSAASRATCASCGDRVSARCVRLARL